MNRRSRQILALTAAALATWTFPFNQVAAIGWLTVAILILPTPRLKPEVVPRQRLRNFLRRFR
ncbi:hypothetical protein [Sphaerobacter thermophilus]|jgi:hypothetical protein|uniref:Shal-type voltage-gated potassium channels N-terminal domain-containing protein n=1 Tax=Sphaerobacter thermophilus (strain ATCC 49802 / DSM 20745 / KCCM 41009 / NCIMB 13125 / S 6022) TaxID=479434 RepID=D1C238_SPHTD|nr:hypothetical protein [Sphaerobacter thermophilus]ACZ38305.1 hypothetical protein Sthe_0868 [Sphaerobacter thermophilus DSM 20745]PZN61559.1 MAG: hypothetical protein DIU58_13775 [Sphaerobacter thermophilus]